MIILSALHLDVKLALLTSLLSALSYLGVTIWAINTFDPNFETMHLHPFLYEIRSVFIFTGGLCAAFVTNEIKKRIIRVNQLWEQKSEIEGLFGQQVSPQVAEALIKDHKAYMLTSGDDIVRLLGWTREYSKDDVLPFRDRSFEERILEVLKSNSKGVHIDELCWKTQIPINKMGVNILNLEFKGIVKSLPGKKFLLVGK